MNAKELMEKHLENWDGCSKASIEYYAESGLISGSLFMALKKCFNEHTNSKLNKIVKELKEKRNKEIGNSPFGRLERNRCYKIALNKVIRIIKKELTK